MLHGLYVPHTKTLWSNDFFNNTFTDTEKYSILTSTVCKCPMVLSLLHHSAAFPAQLQQHLLHILADYSCCLPFFPSMEHQRSVDGSGGGGCPPPALLLKGWLAVRLSSEDMGVNLGWLPPSLPRLWITTSVFCPGLVRILFKHYLITGRIISSAGRWWSSVDDMSFYWG